MGFPVYDLTILKKAPISLVVGYSIQYESIRLSSLAKRTEQADGHC